MYKEGQDSNTETKIELSKGGGTCKDISKATRSFRALVCSCDTRALRTLVQRVLQSK